MEEEEEEEEEEEGERERRRKKLIAKQWMNECRSVDTTRSRAGGGVCQRRVRPTVQV